MAGLALSEPYHFTRERSDGSLFYFDEENNVVKLEDITLENKFNSQ